MTDTAKHTPGPWRVDPIHAWTGYCDVDSVIVSDGYDIATIYGGRELQPQLSRLPTFSECRANARLIAAAPDLLAIATHPVLEHLIATSDHPSVKAIFEPMRRAAIAKAEGQDTQSNEGV